MNNYFDVSDILDSLEYSIETIKSLLEDISLKLDKNNLFLEELLKAANIRNSMSQNTHYMNAKTVSSKLSDIDIHSINDGSVLFVGYKRSELTAFLEASVNESNSTIKHTHNTLITPSDSERLLTHIGSENNLEVSRNSKERTFRYIRDNIKSNGDLASVLTNTGQGDVILFNLREVISNNLLSMLMDAIEDKALLLTIGTGPSARSISLDLAIFTVHFYLPGEFPVPDELVNSLTHIYACPQDQIDN